MSKFEILWLEFPEKFQKFSPITKFSSIGLVWGEFDRDDIEPETEFCPTECPEPAFGGPKLSDNMASIPNDSVPAWAFCVGVLIIGSSVSFFISFCDFFGFFEFSGLDFSFLGAISWDCCCCVIYWDIN